MIKFLFSVLVLAFIASDIFRPKRGGAIGRWMMIFVLVTLDLMSIAPRSVGPSSTIGTIILTMDWIILMAGMPVSGLIYRRKNPFDAEPDPARAEVDLSILNRPLKLHSGANGTLVHGRSLGPSRAQSRFRPMQPGTRNFIRDR